MQQGKGKLVPLWTARLTADHAPSFVSHVGASPSKPPTRFKLRLDKRNRIVREEPAPQIEIKRRAPSMETKLELGALVSANAKHDTEMKGQLHLTQRLFNGSARPAKPTTKVRDLRQDEK